ncbi:MAG TPA: hypothetical protein VF538_17360 [Pyrinomonadaceae bacterium]|jgi:hypothetical protein
MQGRRGLFVYAASLVLMAGLCASAGAQTLEQQTTVYTFDGSRASQGIVPGSSTRTVTYAGQIKSTGKGGIAVRSFSLTLFYTTDGKTANVSGGNWTLTTVKEEIGSSVGGTVDSTATIAFDSKGNMSVKGLMLNISGSTSLGPASGFVRADIDQGTKIKGTLTLTYLVIR